MCNNDGEYPTFQDFFGWGVVAYGEACRIFDPSQGLNQGLGSKSAAS